MTGRDIISAALRKIGVSAPGETIAAQEASDGLSELNRMLSSWSNEKLLVYSRVREVFSLVAGQSSRTIGTGGNFNTTRPQEIDEAGVIVDGFENPVKILRDSSEWAQILDKTTTSDVPYVIYLEGTYPLETINFYPIPTASHSIALYSWKPLTEVASLNTDLSFPPGYEDAIVHNLAIRLAPEYGKAISAEIDQVATETKDNLKRRNHRPRFLKVDAAITGGSRGFDIFTGGSR